MPKDNFVFAPKSLADAGALFAATDDGHIARTKVMAQWYLDNVKGMPDKVSTDDADAIKAGMKSHYLTTYAGRSVFVNRETGETANQRGKGKTWETKWAHVTINSANALSPTDLGQLPYKTTAEIAYKDAVQKYRDDVSKYISLKYKRLLIAVRNLVEGDGRTRSSNKSVGDTLKDQRETALKKNKIGLKAKDPTALPEDVLKAGYDARDNVFSHYRATGKLPETK